MVINLTDVVTDPDLTVALQVIRGEVKTDSNGIASRTNTVYNISGVVNGISAYELERLPESELLKGGIKVATQFTLSSGQGGQTADIIVLNGQQYTVVSVDNGVMYGFTIGFCRLISPRAEVSNVAIS